MKMTHIQVIGRASALKTSAVASLTAIYKAFQQKGLFDGHVKTYKPRVEGTTEDLVPGEERVVQQDAREMLASVRTIQTSLFDATLQQERGNTVAKADLVADVDASAWRQSASAEA